MITNEDVTTIAKKMGDNLRLFRIKGKHGTQETMAFRIGVSEKTYAKMERGEASVSLEKWISVAALFRKTDPLLELMSPESLFDELANNEKIPQRFRP